MEVVGSGSLAPCDGSHAQKWTLQGDQGEQQLVSGQGFGCLSNGPPPGGPPPISPNSRSTPSNWFCAITIAVPIYQSVSLSMPSTAGCRTPTTRSSINSFVVHTICCANLFTSYARFFRTNETRGSLGF